MYSQALGGGGDTTSLRSPWQVTELLLTPIHCCTEQPVVGMRSEQPDRSPTLKGGQDVLHDGPNP